jgi:hypothetical protein
VLAASLLGWLLVAAMAEITFNNLFTFFLAPAALLPDSVLFHSWDGPIATLCSYLVVTGEILAISALAIIVWQKKNILLSQAFACVPLIWGTLLIVVYLRAQHFMKHFLK